jgi:hypothetical protein
MSLIACCNFSSNARSMAAVISGVKPSPSPSARWLLYTFEIGSRVRMVLYSSGWVKAGSSPSLWPWRR